MNAYKAQKRDGSFTTISKEDLAGLKTQIRGLVISQDDEEYDHCRQIWNAMIDKKPAFIVQCTGTADVMAAVKFSNSHQLHISIRSAGHNIAGRSLQDDVMLIDLSQMKTVRVNPENQTVVVSPGATLGDLDHETQAYGLAVPVGINSTTGVAGLTLGGGFGWLSRKFGLTIDSLIAVELVTVTGERIKCDAKNHAELFWAICGGGGNFGIVTAFEFKAHKVGPDVMAGPMIFNIDEAKSVLSNYREFNKTCPDELCVWAVIRNAPPFPFLPTEYHGKPVLILAGIYCGELEQGKKELDKVAALGHPVANAVSPHRFVDFQQAFDPLLTPGARNYWKTHNFKDISDDMIDTIISYGHKLPGIHSEIFLAQVGGATNRIANDATAYPHRDIQFVMNVHTRWLEANDDAMCVDWARDFYRATKPFATGGAYMNFISEGDDSVESAYGDNALKLAAVKQKYDPDNILRTNLNITPS